MSNETTTCLDFYALRGCVLMAHDDQRRVCGEIVYLYARRPGARRKTWQGFAVRTFVPFIVGPPKVLKTRQFLRDEGSFDALLQQAKQWIVEGVRKGAN